MAPYTRYWRGTTSYDWNNINNWSDSSGGSTPASTLPVSGDTLVFDNGSADDCYLAGEYIIQTNYTFTKKIYVLPSGVLLILGGGFDSEFYRGGGIVGIGGSVFCSFGSYPCDCDVRLSTGCTATGVMWLSNSMQLIIDSGAGIDADDLTFRGVSLEHNGSGLLKDWYINDYKDYDSFSGTGPVNKLHIDSCTTAKSLDFDSMPTLSQIDIAGSGNLTLTGDAGVSNARITGVILDDVII